jgi:hypothetical protein
MEKMMREENLPLAVIALVSERKVLRLEIYSGK